MKKSISIITDWSNTLGSGHIQRMANLAVYLNQQENINAFIINKKKPDFLNPKHLDYFSSSIIKNSDLIIRDMRDSSTLEIEKLKQSGKVMVIDDLGPGRELADYKVNLLPSTNISNYNKNYFIYGYNFTQSLQNLNLKTISKEIDITIYSGADNSKNLDRLLKSIPKNLKIAILGVKNPYIIQNQVKKPIEMPYSQILLSSKILLSHFGITLFEAYSAGCKLVSLNPTNYHSDLVDLIKNQMDVLNLGLWDDFNDYNIILEEINNFKNREEVILLEIEEKIRINLNNFYKFILKCISH